MKRVLALQNYWDDPPGYLGEIMQEHDIPCDIVRADVDPFPDPATYSAIFALGGPQNANAYDKYPYLLREKELLRAVVEQDIPYLGICLGGQLLASALNAPITRHHMTEIGFFAVQLTSEGEKDPLFQGYRAISRLYIGMKIPLLYPVELSNLQAARTLLTRHFAWGVELTACNTILK